MTEFQNRIIDAGVTAGVEVMVQTLAPKEAAEAVIALGATPVFVDSEPQTGAMYAEQLRNGIRSRFAETGKMLKAIVPMSLGEKEYNKEYITKVANRYEIPVVEYEGIKDIPTPLHTLPEYSQYQVFEDGVAENLYQSQ